MKKFLDGSSEGEGVNNLVDLMCLSFGDEVEVSKGSKEFFADLGWSRGDGPSRREMELTTLVFQGGVIIERRYLVTQSNANDSLSYSFKKEFKGTRQEWKAVNRGKDYDVYNLVIPRREI